MAQELDQFSSPVICTITTQSHLGFVRCLLDSFFRHHSDGIGYILHLDGDSQFPLPYTSVNSIQVGELSIPEFASMLARYNTFEMCNALKPFLMQHVFAHTEHQKLCYFDSDMFIFAPLKEEVWDQLDTCSILLTPHLCRLPGNDPDLVWRDLAVLQHGVYNGGFIGIRRCPEADEFLHWWGSRIIPCGYKKLEGGMNCDQRWLDLVPGFGLNARVSRHPGLNAGYWNLHERYFELVESQHLVNGQPLGFFHFSGYSPDRPDLITKNWTRFTFENRPDVRPVFDEYQHALERALKEPKRDQIHGAAVNLPAEMVQPGVPGSSEATAQQQAVNADDLIKDRPPVVPLPVLMPRPVSPCPRVSVVIPALNATRYIRQAIDSVLQQTLENLEIIVVDDGSTDNTRAVLATYGDDIRCLTQSHAGVSAARNRGIEAARGEFIAFLDADDYFFLPAKLEEQVACFEQRPELALVHSGWRVIDESGELIIEKKPWLRAPQLDLNNWVLFQPALPSAMIFRRDALLAVDGFDESLAHLEDVDLALRLALQGFPSQWLKKITTAYRRHCTNASLNAGAQAEALAALLNKFFAHPGLPQAIKSLEREVRYNALVWTACRYHQAGRFDEMAQCLVQSLRYSTLSTSATFLDWIERLRLNYQEDFGVNLSVFELTELDQWQQVARWQLMGLTPDETFFPSAKKKLLMDWGLPIVQKRPAAPSLAGSFNGRAHAREKDGEPRHEEAAAYPAKLNLSRALENDYGRHRSGWLFALQSLKTLHDDNGVMVDAFPEHTFDRGQGKPQLPHQKPWIGFLHNPPAIPHWFIRHQSPQSLLANQAFQESLKSCLGFFCLSEYHKRWLENHLNVRIARLFHPTTAVEKTFSMENFLANPDKKIVQIGSWLRKLHSIYFLPVRRLKKTIVHQHIPYIDDFFAAEKKEFQLDPDYRSVEVLHFFSNAEYDDLLSRNIVYLELYDSSANNTIIECIVRTTPILINPLPAVKEYLGEDYPFYFTHRGQAARKAEDAALIEETHRYLQRHPVKEKLTAAHFLKSVAESEIYQNLSTRS